MSLRIGQGFDVHAFDDGQQGRDKIVIGGVMIPYEKGLVAHSDGDVLLHALCDALLGACALGDIGKHFPDTDPAYKNADSRALLRMVYAKMAPYIQTMCANIAEDLQSDKSLINVKATTTECLGFTGRKEGIAAQAAVLLTMKDGSHS